MENWKIDVDTDEAIKPFIIALHKRILLKNEKITSIPQFDSINDFGIVNFSSRGAARKFVINYKGKEYSLGVYMYNRDNGNCLAVTDGVRHSIFLFLFLCQ